MAETWTARFAASKGGDMKRRLRSIALAGAVSSALIGATLGAQPALAQEPELPRHPHMLVLGLELNAEGEPVGFRKCVDLAANQPLPLNAHHQHVHQGTAGEHLFTNAGNVVVPGAPFPGVPWSNCEELIEFFFGQ
jgi:hypothetical protein